MSGKDEVGTEVQATPCRERWRAGPARAGIGGGEFDDGAPLLGWRNHRPSPHRSAWYRHGLAGRIAQGEQFRPCCRDDVETGLREASPSTIILTPTVMYAQ